MDHDLGAGVGDLRKATLKGRMGSRPPLGALSETAEVTDVSASTPASSILGGPVTGHRHHDHPPGVGGEAGAGAGAMGPPPARKVISPVGWEQYWDRRDSVELEGRGSFNVYSCGSAGPVVLCIHGGGYTGLTWSLVAEKLKEKYRVVAPDLRGHGLTTTNDDLDFSKEVMSADIVQLWQALTRPGGVLDSTAAESAGASSMGAAPGSGSGTGTGLGTKAPSTVVVASPSGQAQQQAGDAGSGAVTVGRVGGVEVTATGPAAAGPAPPLSSASGTAVGVPVSDAESGGSRLVSGPGPALGAAAGPGAGQGLASGARQGATAGSTPGASAAASPASGATQGAVHGPVQPAVPGAVQARPGAPPMLLVGHSMGAALSVWAAASGQMPGLQGVVVIDVVEGTALAALPYMEGVLASRPGHFASPEEGIAWCTRIGMCKSKAAVAVSFPSQLRRDPPEGQVQEGQQPWWVWRTPLEQSQPYWAGWYTGLSEQFLQVSCPKMLLLAGTDRLDKVLTIGQMQGKFQLALLPMAGHAIQEDEAGRTAEHLLQFLQRFRIGLPPMQVPKAPLGTRTTLPIAAGPPA